MQLTSDRLLALRRASARHDEPRGVHPREVLRGLEPQADVCAGHDYGLRAEVHAGHERERRPLVFDEICDFELHG